jgi:hypothetical protein
MATSRPSVLKRQREQKKRERQLEKAARAAERRATPPPSDEQAPATENMPRKDDEPCSP